MTPSLARGKEREQREVSRCMWGKILRLFEAYANGTCDAICSE